MNVHQKIGEFVKGDADALAFILGVHTVVELWDDLIDRDKDIAPASIHEAFYMALITLPRNPFYQRNFSLLNPVFEAAIFDWHTANALEATKDVENLRGSFMLRCGVLMLTVMCARIIGGAEWAKHVGVELRSMGDESWQEYIDSFGEK